MTSGSRASSPPILKVMTSFSGSDAMKLNLCTTSGGVAATLLIILCALFTFATVDFGASSGGLDWLLDSRPGWISKDFWNTPHHRPLPSQLSENSSRVESQLESVSIQLEWPEIAHPAPSPIAEESDPSSADSLETVESAPSPLVVSVGDLEDGDNVDYALSPSEGGFDDSGDLDPLEDATAPESSVDDSAEERSDHQSGPAEERDYDVCLVVTMGRSGVGTERRALPYSELYRLFNATKSLRKERIFVGTNYDLVIFCRMVRDALGPAAKCFNFNRVGVAIHKCEHLVVGTTEKYISQPSSSELQKYGFRWDIMKSVDLDVEDPARKPPLLPESEWRPTIVTGFSSNHVEVGLLLLRSLGRVAAQQSEFNVSVVVWTMDRLPYIALKALECVVGELQSVYKVQTEVRAFDFNAWPSWMRINQKKGYKGGRGEYAWKAVMIHTMLVERGFVYWADAGDRFKSVAGLTQTLRNVKLKGFVSRHSSGHVKDWCHPMQLVYFGANSPRIKRQLNCDASGIGFTLKSYSKLARPWYECSITRQCIAPDGSSRKNHRQDQAALTVLAILTGAKCEGVSSEIVKNMDNRPNSNRIGVDPTSCYRDPLNIKWHRKLM